MRTLLAGPLLRRVDAHRACVWLATSRPVAARVIVSRFTDGGLTQIGEGGGESIRLGDQLWVHLVQARPSEGEWPADELLAYDLHLRAEGDGPQRDLGELGLLDDETGIAYPGLPLPTFFRRVHLPDPILVHGSCRLFHGLGEDAFLAADHALRRSASGLSERPCVLFLTGDQIYGDDVAGPLISHLRQLATAVVGEHDDVSVPGMPPLSSLPVYGRGDLVAERACFTSPKSANHLVSFGEFAAAHLLALDPGSWPTEWPPAPDGLSRAQSKQYDHELSMLDAARRAVPAARRVLANVPTYMIFDDHDVTDDWNLSQEWVERVSSSRSGRRIVTSALAAYWAFQGWGNAPDEFDAAFKEAVCALAAGQTGSQTDVDRLLWGFEAWSFVAPTEPPAIVLNTRTRRDFDAPRAAARLIGADERERVRKLAAGVARQDEEPLLVVSPVPVFGLELQERREKFLAGKIGPYEIDFEGWHSNLQGFADFMRLLIEDLEVTRCILLSGDVHYGITTRTTFEIGNRSAVFAQLVSSSFKHSGRISKAVLELLGQIVKKRHERLGWRSPPDVTSAKGLWDRLLGRMVNTDEWNEEAPVFLAPRIVNQMNTATTPEYRECRIYIRPEEQRASVLAGENNVGFVKLRSDDLVVHSLLSFDGHRLRTRTARVELVPDPPARTAKQSPGRTGARS